MKTSQTLDIVCKFYELKDTRTKLSIEFTCLVEFEKVATSKSFGVKEVLNLMPSLIRELMLSLIVGL
jgi:hypothetical protein